MRLFPFTRLRHFGIGDEAACLSRGSHLLGVLSGDTDGKMALAIESLSVIAHCQRIRPAIADLLRKKRAEGHLSLGASWASLYHNPVEPEDLIRGLLIGQQWLIDHLGAASEEVYLGLARSGVAQLPQILKQVGVVRVAVAGVEGAPDRFTWRSPEGSDLQAWNVPSTTRVLEALSREPGKAKRAVWEVVKLFSKHGTLGVGEEGWIPPIDLLERLADAGMSDSVVLTSLEAVCEGVSADVQSTWLEQGVSPESIHPSILTKTASISRALIRAEAVLAMATCLGKPAEPTEPLWRRLLDLLDGSYGGTSDRLKSEQIRVEAAGLTGAVGSLVDDAERWVAEQVMFEKGPEGTLGLVVFNPNAWTATGPVEAHLLFYGDERLSDFERYELYRVVDESGTPTEVEETSGKQVETAEIGLRFIARDVPACGYRTYYLIPKPSRPDALMPIQAPGAMTPEFAEPSFAIEDVEERISEPRRGIRLGRRFTVRDFVLNVDEVSGGIEVIDRRSDRTLVRRLALEVAEDGLATAFGHHDPTGRSFALVPERIDLTHSGSVSATLLVEGRLVQSPAQLAITMYADLPWMDIEVEVDWRDRVPGLIQAVFERPSSDTGEVTYATPFGSAVVTEAGARHVHGWVAVADPTWVLASDRRSFRFGEHDIRTDLYLSTVDPSSYSYHRVWRSPPGPISARFRMQAGHSGHAIECAARLSSTLHHPLSLKPVYDAVSDKSLAPSASACSVGGEGIVVTSVRPVEAAIEVRAYEALGQESEACVIVDGAISGTVVSPLGDPLEEVDPRCVPFRPYEIKTIRIQKLTTKTRRHEEIRGNQTEIT